MATFSLDDIRAAADKKYGHTDIPMGDGSNVRLVNALRLSKDKRAELTSIQDKMNAEGADQAEVLAEAIRIVAEDHEQAERLLSALNGDLALLVQTFAFYTEGTEAGEASGSQD